MLGTHCNCLRALSCRRRQTTDTLLTSRAQCYALLASKIVLSKLGTPKRSKDVGTSLACPARKSASSVSQGSLVWRDACRCFREIESVAYIKHVLTDTTHNGFPVLAPTDAEERHPVPLPTNNADDGRGGALRGLILRSQLLVLLENKVTRCAVGLVSCVTALRYWKTGITTPASNSVRRRPAWLMKRQLLLRLWELVTLLPCSV